MKCCICGEEFDENKIEGVRLAFPPYINRPQLIKAVKSGEHFYRPCQRCLLHFLDGIKFGRYSCEQFERNEVNEMWTMSQSATDHS